MVPVKAPFRLLLVDDNRDNLALLRLYLENAPYVLDEAHDGAVAVTMFAAAPYDLVLMDLEMPVLDGYEATRRIRALEQGRATAPVPILALTAHALDEHCRLSRAAGFTDFLVKPVRKAVMLQALRRRLGLDEPAAPSPPVQDRQDDPNPARLAGLLPIFFDAADQALAAVQTAANKGDMAEVQRQGHKLKGSAGSYGFGELAQAAAALERAAATPEAVAAWQWASALLAKARLDWPA